MKIQLNASQLKILACLFMLIDHIGYLLFPQFILLRIIGRLSFPIFAYMVANSYHYTNNASRYIIRMLVFSVCFQPVFTYCMNPAVINIFATLCLGMLAIFGYNHIKKTTAKEYLAIIAVFACGITAQILHTDYGFYGVAMIFIAHLYRNEIKQLLLFWTLLTVCFSLINSSIIQLAAPAAVIFISLYNDQRGHVNKWIFYIFYCVHIPLLYALSQLLY